MITEPKVEHRDNQHYMAIRTLAAIPEFPTVIPQLLGEVFAWLKTQDIEPAGAPLIRYLVIDMEAKLDIELGVPVADVLSGNDRIRASVIPAGRYASLIYTGIENGFKGNEALINWAAANGIRWDRWDDENGDAFRSRVEYFLTDPDDEPDPAKWETEVAILVADN